MKKSKVLITNIEISTQGDIDFICDNLPDGDTFDGPIIITTEEVLDYKCLSKIRHVQGTLSLKAPGASKAFRNIESIIGGEGFFICDEAVDTLYFPALKTIENDLGISISSGCSFSNVLYLPNIETFGSLSITSPFIDEARSGTIMGFDKVLEMHTLSLDTSNGIDDNIKIDGFSNLRTILVEFKFQKFNKALQVSEKSFNNLVEVAKIRIVQEYDPHDHTELNLEYLFPNLKSSDNMELLNIDPNEACYLKEHIASGDISIGILNTLTNEFYGNEGLMSLCE